MLKTKTIHPSFCRAHLARYARGGQRQFSIIASHSSFPATLIRYSSRTKSNLYNRIERLEREDDVYEDAVEVSANGLVGPAASASWTLSNGALFMPNTFKMRELIRTNFDRYVESEEAGRTPDIPQVYTVLKGTPIPSSLQLIHEVEDQFSLQPSRKMPLKELELNDTLDDFYTENAEKTSAEEWLNANDPYSRAGR